MRSVERLLAWVLRAQAVFSVPHVVNDATQAPEQKKRRRQLPTPTNARTLTLSPNEVKNI